MNHRSRLLDYACLAAFAFTAAGCGKSDSTAAEKTNTPKEPAKEVKLAPLDLSKANADYPFTMDAPTDAKAKDGILGVEISNGSSFQVELGDAKDFAALKKEIAANKLNQLKKFHTESKDVLIYESQISGQPNTEFHFLANVKVGDKTIGVEDGKGGTYTQAQVELMVKCVQSLKGK
jgi:hypothetical protein